MKNNKQNKKHSEHSKQHSHYYSETQQGVFEAKEIKTRLLGNELVFKTAAGVFSKDRVDKGTEILIENCVIKKDWKVLDLGSGIGIVGIAVAKKYGCEVVMVEINKRAHMLSKENVILNGLKEKIKAYQGDSFSALAGGAVFDTVLLNPPQSAGRDICLKMIDGSFSHLSKNGTLQIVARHNKGGATLSKYMETVFGNVKEIAKKSGYRVYLSQKI